MQQASIPPAREPHDIRISRAMAKPLTTEPGNNGNRRSHHVFLLCFALTALFAVFMRMSSTLSGSQDALLFHRSLLFKGGGGTAPAPAPSPVSSPAPSMISDRCIDDNENCPGWAENGECENNPGYMLVNCLESCGVCTVAPTSAPTLARTGMECEENSDCHSNVCDPTTKLCFASEECKALKLLPGETFNKDKIIIIFVGSDFSSLSEWQNQIQGATFTRFEDFPFFGSDSDYVAFYVNQLEDSFCHCGGPMCFNVDRLLCCDTTKAKSLAEKCFSADIAHVQIVAVHNTDVYCASGGEIATVSTNELGAIVGVHEIGHSLFDLQDEYDWDYVGQDIGPNCDSSPQCSRWADLVGVYPDLCKYKGCDEDAYVISEENSFMNGVNTNVGPVLRRFTCCTYYALTSRVFDYCAEFLNSGDGLVNFCENSGYTPASVEKRRDDSKIPINTPSKMFVYVSHPIIFVLDISSLGTSESGSISTDASKIPRKSLVQPGYFPSTQIHGDYTITEAAAIDPNKVIKAEIHFESGSIESRFYSAFTTLHAPPPDPNVAVTATTLSLLTSVNVPKSVIEILVEENLADAVSQVTVALMNS